MARVFRDADTCVSHSKRGASFVLVVKLPGEEQVTRLKLNQRGGKNWPIEVKKKFKQIEEFVSLLHLSHLVSLC